MPVAAACASCPCSKTRERSMSYSWAVVVVVMVSRTAAEDEEEGEAAMAEEEEEEEDEGDEVDTSVMRSRFFRKASASPSKRTSRMSSVPRTRRQRADEECAGPCRRHALPLLLLHRRRCI